MVQLIQNNDGNWTVGVNSDGERIGELTHVHAPHLCEGRGCGIHNHPSDHSLKNAPMEWRSDRGILERICEHGVGHPDADSAAFLTSIGKDYKNIHNCDGCCGI